MHHFTGRFFCFAVLVDRDNNPIWQPPRLEDVSNELVDKYFENLPEDRELKIIAKS